MPAYKDEERGTWYCEFRYKEVNGISKKKKKRGFKTKKEASEYERSFLSQLSTKAETIYFKDLAEIYLKDMETRLKASSFNNKKNIFILNLMHFFKYMLFLNINHVFISKWKN